MRVLVATGLYPPEIGGPATYAKLLANELPKRGIEVDVLPFSTVRSLPPVVRHVVYAAKVFSRARGADIIFVQDTVSTGLPVVLAAKLWRIPVVLRVPGDYAWEQGRQRFGVRDSCDDFQRKHYGARIGFLRAIQRFVARSASAIVAPSRYFAGIVQGWGIPAERIRVIYNSVSAVGPVLPPRAPDGRVIVTVGRLVPWKGFGTLIDLLPQLRGWHLVVIGDGPLRAELEQRSKKHDIGDRVMFTGALSRAEVFGWYAKAHVFVLNSSFESFSYQTAEALAAGIPVVATNIGSLPELVVSGKEGVLVAPDDTAALRAAIESVAAEPEVWRARVEAGKLKAKKFSPDLMLREFETLCRALARTP